MKNLYILFSTLKSSIFIISLLILGGCGDDIKEEQPIISKEKLSTDLGVTGDGLLKDKLDDIRAAYNIPAIAAFIIEGNQILEMEASGYMVNGQSTQVKTDSRWHLGSFTKSMTATVAAKLVEQELISMESKIIDVFPEFSGKIKPDYETITLVELLSMTSGLIRDLPGWEAWRNKTTPIINQRREWTLAVLNTDKQAERGSYSYSNAAYVIVAHMLEKVTDQTWEDLIQQELFTPLNMTDVGFRPPSLGNSVKQPSGHYYKDAQWKTQNEIIIPDVMGPAGAVNANMNSVALYLMAQLEGARGVSNILTESSYALLHKAVSKNYALGWEIFYNQDKSNSIFGHAGSNGRWTVNSRVFPEKNIAIMALSNSGGTNSQQAVDQAMKVLFQRNL